VRVFHPARRDFHGDELVSWAEIAESNGTTVNPAMQLNALTHGYWFDPQPAVYGEAPAMGRVPQEVMPVLVSVLAEHTATVDRCWFAFWNGYGDTTSDIRSAPTFKAHLASTTSSPWGRQGGAVRTQRKRPLDIAIWLSYAENGGT
jgi:hypothetical protein